MKDELKEHFESLLKEKERVMSEKYKNDVKDFEYKTNKAKNEKEVLVKEVDLL